MKNCIHNYKKENQDPDLSTKITLLIINRWQFLSTQKTIACFDFFKIVIQFILLMTLNLVLLPQI